MKKRMIRCITAGLGVALAAAVLAVGSAAHASGPSCSAGGTTELTGGPSSTPLPLTNCLTGIANGGTVKLGPGYYTWGDGVGDFHPYTLRGTASSKVVIAGLYPSVPPVVWGGVQLLNAANLDIGGLVMRGTVAGATPTDAGMPALQLYGAANVRIHGNEILGAKDTNAYANVSFGSSPQALMHSFQFDSNCVHDAAQGVTPDRALHLTDHNLYVDFGEHGEPIGAGPFVITRNLIWGNKAGAGIKIGSGGLDTDRGPQNLTVSYNTIGEGSRQILLTGDVRNNLVTTNLLFSASAPADGNSGGKSAAVYIHRLNAAATGNRLAHSYVWNADLVAYATPDSVGKVSTGTDNSVYTTSPGWQNNDIRTCSGWRPTDPTAKQYGRWAS